MNVPFGFCTVSYLGYNNEEKVSMKSLMKTLGERSRHQQIKEAEQAGYGSEVSFKLLKMLHSI